MLWYRRALAGGLPGRTDPWLADNLALARRELGSPRVRPGGWARWAAWRDPLLAGGCLLAWAALALEVAGRRWRGLAATALGLALLGAAAFAAGWQLAVRGPREAVLLAACGELSAGAEVWIRGGRDGAFQVLDSDGDAFPCPAAAVGLVEP